jgi:hemoglobin
MDLSIHQELAPEDIYGIIGEEGITRFVAAFYRQVATDDILRPMYPDEDFAGAEMRLREFLVFRLGGPQRYIAERGHPRLRMRHAPFPIDQQARDRWVALMDNAVQQQAFPADVTTALRTFFHDVATFLINRPAA